MKDFEFNKIFAAVLVAGIVASSAHFIAEKAVHPKLVRAPGAEAEGEAAASGEAAPAKPEPILSLIAKANTDHGKQIAKACAACHNMEKGGPNGVGPALWDVMTRGMAAKDFAYSDDMAKHKGQMWSYEELNHFIWKPRSLVPGTKMTFPGLKKPQDRADVIAFLRTLADSPPAEPSAAEIDQEQKDLGAAPIATNAKPGAPATAPNNSSAPAGQGGAAATPVTKGKTPEEAENPASSQGNHKQVVPASSTSQ